MTAHEPLPPLHERLNDAADDLTAALAFAGAPQVGDDEDRPDELTFEPTEVENIRNLLGEASVLAGCFSHIMAAQEREEPVDVRWTAAHFMIEPERTCLRFEGLPFDLALLDAEADKMRAELGRSAPRGRSDVMPWLLRHARRSGAPASAASWSAEQLMAFLTYGLESSRIMAEVLTTLDGQALAGQRLRESNPTHRAAAADLQRLCPEMLMAPWIGIDPGVGDVVSVETTFEVQPDGSKRVVSQRVLEPPTSALPERLATAASELEGRLGEEFDDDTAGLDGGKVHELVALLREAAARLHNPVSREAFGGWLVTTFQHGLVDPAAVLMPTGEWESGDDFCRRVLQLALDRGAFAPDIVGPFDDRTVIRRLEDTLQAHRHHARALADYLVAEHVKGDVDDAARAKLDGSDREHTLGAALRLLRLAKARGAFNPSPNVESGVSNLCTRLLSCAGLITNHLEAAPSKDRAAEGTNVSILSTASQLLDEAASTIDRLQLDADYYRGEARGATAQRVQELEQRLVEQASSEAQLRHEASEALAAARTGTSGGAPECTGDVLPTAHGAVETRFVEMFYIAGERMGLRFEGMADIYVPRVDADRLARAVITGNDGEMHPLKLRIANLLTEFDPALDDMPSEPDLCEELRSVLRECMDLPVLGGKTEWSVQDWSPDRVDETDLFTRAQVAANNLRFAMGHHDRGTTNAAVANAVKILEEVAGGPAAAEVDALTPESSDEERDALQGEFGPE